MDTSLQVNNAQLLAILMISIMLFGVIIYAVFRAIVRAQHDYEQRQSDQTNTHRND